MRFAKTDRPRQRPGRSWRIPNAVEQAGVVGKRPAVPGHDGSPLARGFNRFKNRGFQMRDLEPNHRDIPLTNSLSFRLLVPSTNRR